MSGMSKRNFSERGEWTKKYHAIRREELLWLLFFDLLLN